jgi:hypothetical protein
MTDTEAKDVAEELAALSLEQRRQYLADLAKTDEAAERMVREALLALWEERKG